MATVPTAPLRVLVLGGSSEGSALVDRLAGQPGIAVTLSLAGRTKTAFDVAREAAVPTRVGGFGGIEGLEQYLREQVVDVLVDATHPFATQMSAHARAAVARVGCTLLRVTRPPWQPEPGDRWTFADSLEAAAAAIGEQPRRVFLTVGRLGLAAFAVAPHHRYLVRTIDPVGGSFGLPDACFITGRGPFDEAGERSLLRDHRIEVVVTKNSGGAASAPKLAAARALALPVILVRRPAPDPGTVDVETAMATIAHQATTAARRGV